MRSEFVVVRKDIGKMSVPYLLWSCKQLYGMVFCIVFCESPIVLYGLVQPSILDDHWETTYRNVNEGISYYEETMFNFTARTHYPDYPYTLFVFAHFWHLELIFVLHFASMPLNIYQKL